MSLLKYTLVALLTAAPAWPLGTDGMPGSADAGGAAQAANPTTLKITGDLESSNGRFYLTDCNTKVKYELRGANLPSHAGQTVEVTGTSIAGATVATGVSQAVQVTIIQQAAASACPATGPSRAAVAGIVGAPGLGRTLGILLAAPVVIPVITVRALLADAEKGEIKATESLWVGPHEADGYGLYSYILFASHPGSARYDDYRALIREYLRMFGDVGDYRKLRRKDLNVTYVPIAPKRDRGQEELLEDWILENYGYQRAIQLLQKAGMQAPNGGPYIISSAIPLTKTSKKPVLVFYQDLQGVPGDLMALYLRTYERRLSRPPSPTAHAFDTL